MTYVYWLVLLTNLVHSLFFQGTLCIDDACRPHQGPALVMTEEEQGKHFVWTADYIPVATFGTVPSSAGIVSLIAEENVPVGFRFQKESQDAASISIRFDESSGDEATIEFPPGVDAAILLVPPGNYNATVSAEKHLNAYLPRIPIVRTDSPPVFTVALQPAPDIRGQVVSSADSRPVAAAEFSSQSGTSLGATDDAGAFHLKIVAEIPRQIIVEAAGFAPTTIEYAGVDDLGTIVLEAGYSLELTVEHPSAVTPLPLTVKVREKRQSGKPGRSLAEAEGETGTRIVLQGLDAGPHFLELSGPGPFQQLLEEIEILPTDANQQVIWIDPATIRGLVTYGDDLFPGASVNLKHSEGWAADVVTDTDGEFEGELWQRGDMAAIISGGELKTPYFTMERLGDQDPIYLDLQIPATRIEGLVTNEEGTPLSGIPISVQSVSGEVRFSQQARTDAQGRYLFTGVLPGSHRLEIEATGYLPAAASVETKREDSSVQVDLRLESGAMLTIMAQRPDGSPVPNAMVAVGVTPDRFGHERLINGDALGIAKIPLKRGQPVSLYVIVPTGGWAHRLVSIEEDQQLQVEVPYGGTDVTVSAADQSGTPVGSVGVVVRHDGTMIPYSTWRFMQAGWANPMLSDDIGNLVIRGLPPGFIELFPFTSPGEAQALMYAQGGNGVQFVSDGQTDLNISVKLEPRGADAHAP